MKIRLHCILLGPIAAVSLLSPAYGQDARATIAGSIKDASGAGVVDATVTARNAATGVQTSTKANGSGMYRMPYLSPGTYDVTAEAQGFKTYIRKALELRISDTAELDIALQIGDLTQSVTVSGSTPLLQPDSASTDMIIDTKSLVDMPISGGNALTTSLMAPGVTNFTVANHPYELASSFVASRISVSGMRKQNTQFTVDGSPAMSNDTAIYTPPADLVQEVKIEGNSFDAAYGHSVGGYVNTVTRSGENHLHGSLYEFHTDASLDGIDLFQRNQWQDPAGGPATSSKLKGIKGGNINNRFGGSIGGPIFIPKVYDGHNKSFWMFGYEGFRNPTTLASSGSYWTVPTQAERDGDFSALLALGPSYQIYDPATTRPAGNGLYTRNPFPGNIIPKARLDAVAQAYLKYYPLPNSSNQTTAADLNNYFLPTIEVSNYDVYSGRVDHNFNEKHKVFGSFTRAISNVLFDKGFRNAATLYTTPNRITGVVLNDVYAFSPSFLLNIQYSFTRFNSQNKPASASVNLSDFGLPSSLISQIPALAAKMPQIAIDGSSFTGLATVQPSLGPITTYHTAGALLTKLAGRHAFRFGGDYRVYLQNAYSLSDGSPELAFGSTYTNGPFNTAGAAPLGQGLASFLLGIPTSGNITVNTSYAFASKYWSAFLQDDFKVSSRLTLNLGIRYEFETAPVERYNRSVQSFDANATSPISATAVANYSAHPIPQIPAGQFQVNGGLTYAGVGGNPRGLWNQGHDNIAPRVGASFAINSKTIVRGGYGIFYMSRGLDYAATGSQDNATTPDRWAINQLGFSQQTNLVASTDNGVTYSASLANPFPNGLSQPTGSAAGLGSGLGQSISYYTSQQKNGRAQRWAFGFQRDLPKGSLLEIMYVGSSGQRLWLMPDMDAVPAQYYSTSPVRDQATINLLSSQVSNPFYPLLPGTSLSGKTVNLSQLLLPHPQFTDVTTKLPGGSSIYHSIYGRVEKRFSYGFSIQGTYTLSKYMQDTEYLNPSDTKPFHVISDLDIPQQAAISGMFDVMVGRGRRFGSNFNRFEDALFGGWQIGMTWEAQSGTPLSWGNVLFMGDVKDIALPRGRRTTNQWFNVNAGFDRSAANQLADNIRTFPLRLPGVRTQGMSNVNDSAMKYFRLSEGTKLQIRCEMMNAFNRTQLSSPNVTPTSSAFGTITSSQSDPREIFFAGKIIF